MKLNVQKLDNATILNIVGRIDGTTALDFERQASQAILEDSNALVCDFRDVSYISSAGLRVVLILAKQISGKGSVFSICGQRGAVAEVFRLSGFEKIIPFYPNAEDALVALQGAP